MTTVINVCKYVEVSCSLTLDHSIFSHILKDFIKEAHWKAITCFSRMKILFSTEAALSFINSHGKENCWVEGFVAMQAWLAVCSY